MRGRECTPSSTYNLGRVLPDRERAGERLTRVFVPKPREVHNTSRMGH